MRAACGMASEGRMRARMLVGITRETWLRAGYTGSFDGKKRKRGRSLSHLPHVTAFICTARSLALAAYICSTTYAHTGLSMRR